MENYGSNSGIVSFKRREGGIGERDMGGDGGGRMWEEEFTRGRLQEEGTEEKRRKRQK